MYRDLSDLGSQILIRILPKERTQSLPYLCLSAPVISSL